MGLVVRRVMIAVGVLVLCVAIVPQLRRDPSVVLKGARVVSGVFMAAGGTGSACTASAPCGSLATAVAVASNGATITLAGGNYGNQVVPKTKAGAAVKSVTVTPKTGQVATFGKTALSTPGITLTGINFTGGLSIKAGPTVIRHVHITGASIQVRANNVTVTDSLIEGGRAHDGINVAGYPNRTHDVLLQRNTIRDIGQSGKYQEHPDCIQIFDAYNISVEQNNLYDCYNSGITFSGGNHKGLDNVLVQSNFIQGCLAARQTCGNGGASMDLRTHVSNFLIRNNTFGSGSLRMPYQPGVTATHNIVGYLSVARPCTTSLSNSLIAAYPSWACKHGAPGATNTTNSGNQIGTPTYVNAAAGNLHLKPGSPVPTSSRPSVASAASASQIRDIDGQPLASDAMGADQVGSTPSQLSTVYATPTGPESPLRSKSSTSGAGAAPGSSVRSTPTAHATSSWNGGKPLVWVVLAVILLIGTVALGIRRRGKAARHGAVQQGPTSGATDQRVSDRR